MNVFKVAAIAATIACSPSAFASTTINFDTFPGGAAVPDETPITMQYASLGVTFSATATGGATVAPVATNYAGGPTGPNYSGNYLGNAPSGAPYVFNPNFQVTPRYDSVSIFFNGTASNLSLSLNNFSNVSNTTFNAYGTSGNLLQTFVFQANMGWTRVSVAPGGIARLDLLTSQYNSSNQFFGIDQLTFDLTPTAGGVPEPATWGMMILGFAAAGSSMRRRKSANAVRYAV